jgi:hypothetical protein
VLNDWLFERGGYVGEIMEGYIGGGSIKSLMVGARVIFSSMDLSIKGCFCELVFFCFKKFNIYVLL